MKKVSIIIPVFNEINTIRELLEKIKNAKFADLQKEIIIVDDASTDGTKEFLQEKTSEYKIIFNSKNGGKTSAIQSGIKSVTGDFTVIQDADLEYNPEDFDKILPLLANDEADAVFGSRFLSPENRNKFLFKSFIANKFLTTLTNILFGSKLTDMETCYKAFKSPWIKNIEIQTDGFGFEPEITAKLLGDNLRIKEVPISYNGRKNAEGKKIKAKDFFCAVFVLLKYRFFAKFNISKFFPVNFLRILITLLVIETILFFCAAFTNKFVFYTLTRYTERAGFVHYDSDNAPLIIEKSKKLRPVFLFGDESVSGHNNDNDIFAKKLSEEFGRTVYDFSKNQKGIWEIFDFSMQNDLNKYNPEYIIIVYNEDTQKKRLYSKLVYEHENDIRVTYTSDKNGNLVKSERKIPLYLRFYTSKYFYKQYVRYMSELRDFSDNLLLKLFRTFAENIKAQIPDAKIILLTNNEIIINNDPYFKDYEHTMMFPNDIYKEELQKCGIKVFDLKTLNNICDGEYGEKCNDFPINEILIDNFIKYYKSSGEMM